ncbi:SusC/RagA family TonB-linked outer membrane protein [Prolixibacteraceae bacterium Z1-6]|uniref:SusC/RagA family TonB-linked outer membrane protein n=1 Tax=Draconibacterium aestuarii TaxID=2998507 RepID=A0A9X3J6Y9_9BACT|nr:SusC/RagA family TonB-linked outer membrane protein [Prolixibacteraceae bacterium Z1-6]
MKKKKNYIPLLRNLKKMALVMRLCFLLLLISVTCAMANSSYSQSTKLSLDLQNASVREVFELIEESSEFIFVFYDDIIDLDRKVSVKVENVTVDKILEKVFEKTDNTYTFLDRQIVISSKEKEADKSLKNGSKNSEDQPQGKDLSGTVTNESGDPLPGATILFKGTTRGTVTNIDGSYSFLEVPENTVLVFSFVGMKPQEVVFNGQSSINIKMVADAIGIEEVVAIAYGTVRKKDLTGSISTVDSKLISTQANSTVTRALEGAVAGIQVAAIDGQPGLDMGIRLRGVGSASQNNSNALIVIDGVPAQHSNPLSTINSKDIESVTILKDAVSTALYGSRGANGVVLITTKKGTTGKTKISFEGRWGVNQVGPYQYDKISNPKDIYEYAWQSIYNSVRYGVDGSGISKNYTTNVQNPNMSAADAAEFASAHLFDYTGSTSSYSRNALGNWMAYDVPGAIYTTSGSGSTASSTMSGAYLVNTDGTLNPNANLLYSDNYDKYLLESKLRQEYNVSASGGNDKVDYFVSLGYLEDPSYIRGSSFKRYNGRSSINAQMYKWLKVGTNVAYSNRETQSPSTRYGRNPGSAVANIFRFINGQNQLIPLYARDSDGNVIYENGEKKVHVAAGDSYSPLGLTSTSLASADVLTMLDNDQDIRKSSDLVTRSYAEVKLMKDLTFTTNLALEKYHETRTRYWQSETGQAAGTGAYGKTYQNVTVLNTQQLLNYVKDVEKHHFDAMAGHEFNSYHLENINFKSAYELIPNFVSDVNFVGRYVGGTFSSPSTGEVKRAMESYFGRGRYVYDNKYYAEASLRRDGSSKFKNKEDRWGTFWSIGSGWRISSESFMEDTKNWLNTLKLRTSYGVIGNQSGIGNYSGYQTWSYSAKYTETTGGSGTPASYVLKANNFVNDGLTWENSHTFDVGVDVSLFNRVFGTFDYYNRNTINTVWNQPIAYSLGQTSIQTNTAKIQNKGYEVELNIDIIKQKDLFWTVSLNGTHYRTILKDVPPGVGSDALDGNWTANADSWSAAGTGTSSNVTYLRGIDKDYYNLYIFKYAGVDQNTGLPLFYHKVTAADHADGLYPDVEVGKDGKTTNYTTASRYEMGSSIPDWIGGFSTTLRYKNFDFSGMLAYQLGGKFYSTEYGNNLYRSDNLGSALSAELIGNTWTPDNTDAEFPMAMYGNTYGDGSTFGSWMYSDMALFSASYLNIKNLTLGYTFSKAQLQRYGISNLRIYVSGDNLLMVTSHSGIDPRMSLVGGFDVGAYSYPSMRTISFGINLDL